MDTKADLGLCAQMLVFSCKVSPVPMSAPAPHLTQVWGDAQAQAAQSFGILLLWVVVAVGVISFSLSHAGK